MNKGNKLTLKDFETNPHLYTWEIQTPLGEEITLRPLQQSDTQKLTTFLRNLSLETRRLSTFDSYDEVTAKELCDAVSKYDKLRFVLENQKREIIGLIEFTLDIPENVLEQYKGYGIDLDIDNTCRFGPTLADDYQSKGLGSLIFSFVIKIAELLDKKYIILYGGVFADNTRAIKYYEKHGFKIVGKYTDENGRESVDMILNI